MRGVSHPILPRASIAAAAALVAAIVFSGCIGFDGTPTGKQLNAKKVEVKFKACTGDTPPTCTDDKAKAPTANAAEQTSDDPVRALIGIRAPHGTGVPNQFTAQGSFAGPDTTFTYNKPYTDALNAAAPRPGDSRYAGYTSPLQDAKRAEQARGVQSVPFRLVLRLPDEHGSKFKWRPVLGFTLIEDPTQPVSCGQGSEVYEGTESSFTRCIDAPDTFEETSKSLKIPLD